MRGDAIRRDEMRQDAMRRDETRILFQVPICVWAHVIYSRE